MNMFGRFFKNKEDGKGGPPGHQRQGGQNDEPPAGGGFFNLPPPVSKPYGGQNAAGPSTSNPAAAAPAQTGGSLFSGLDVAPAAPAPQRKSTRSSGSFNYLDVAASSNSDALNSSQYSRTSVTSSTGTTASRSSSKAVKKKKKKTFRPGFGRQLSDESAAALQRGDLKEDEVIQQQREGRLMSDRSDSSRSSRSATNPTDLAHLLPPVKSGSVLQGLTVHKGSTPSSGGGVLAGLTTPSSVADDDVNDTPVEEPPTPEVYKKAAPPVPAAPPTPEERLFNTLRDFHESSVSFRQLTVKQNEDENRLLERKAQLANQLTQYEMDLRDVEAQQHHACEVEDFEKADALNATINSVRHCITLTESDVRKVDSELVAFVKAKEKAFANQLKSTRGTLRELEKFREDQESERTCVRNEYKLYESNQTEQLQFEAERIDTEMHHVSVSLENVVAEKSEIESTIEDQCSSEFAVQAQLIEEKQAVEEEVRELERKLKEKLERVQEIQSSIDKAQRDIDTVRGRYSRQLKRIADREEGIKKTKEEVESDGEHLEQQRLEFQEKLKRYADDISVIGKRIGAVKKEMRAASLLAHVLEVQETRREQSLIRKKQQTAELSSLHDATAEMVEVVEMELQDLKERIDKREVEFEEKKKELKEMEKHLELATLQELWKEAKHLRTALRKIEKCKSEGDAANEGIDFRSSAMLLVQADYDACILQVETLERKYDVSDPSKDEEVEDDDDDDESIDDEDDEGSEHISVSRSSLTGKAADVEGSDVDVSSSIEDSSSMLEDIAMQLLDLELQIEKATENEDYDLAARLDEKIEALKERQQVIEASVSQDASDDVRDNDFSRDYADEANSNEHSAEEEEAEVEYAHEEMVSPVSAVRSQEELTQSLETIQLRVVMLEKQIELATDNEDYDTAANYDEELESLREEQKSIQAQLGSTSQSAGEVVAEPTTTGSLFGGLHMSNGPATDEGPADAATEPAEEAKNEMFASEEMESPTKLEDFSPTSSSLKDSFFGKPEISSNEDVIAPSASGSIFGGLQMSGSFHASTSSVSSPEKAAEEVQHDEQTPSGDAESTNEKVDSSTAIPVDNEGMFGGLQLSSSAVSIGADTQAELVPSSTAAPVDMFGGLQLSGSGITESAAVDTASDAAPVDMFGGLQLSSSAVDSTSAEPASVSNETSTGMFGGLQLSDSALGSAEVESASPIDETDDTKNEEDTRMSIHELSEHSNADSSITTSATLLSETTSTETILETTSTTVSTTTITKLSDDAVGEAEQSATQP
ncbi:hypothetical protein P3T76_010379 [Phytophthora citrophthora]|uniref:UVR domain-containing protein n=1 Tax=Phytophthora citrophthora TaxID=4793 RepID=A0AAD9GC84_9STRA|nr:hypothetical protein P3T76_010379 [Phytophthora citrophthora]